MRNSSESSIPKPLPFGERLERGFAFFNSKLLLFGEYGLMYNAMALSIPFKRFSGCLDFDTDQKHPESSAEIQKFYEHLKAGETIKKLNFPFDIESLGNDLNQGLYFNSTIPQQYGVGSSGALVAALFSRYAVGSIPEKELLPELLKADFALLESYFHGKSSGIDPLISFLNQPLLIDSKKTIHPVSLDLPKSGLSFALIDTGITGATGPLVQHFIELYSYPEFQSAFEKQFIPANNGCIESLLNVNQSEFFHYLNLLIKFQLQHFKRMIPGNFHNVITDALNENVFIKLLGSGGGGFLLAIAETEDVLKSWAGKQGIQTLIATNNE